MVLSQSAWWSRAVRYEESPNSAGQCAG